MSDAKVGKFLGSTNPYLQTILHPATVGGVKVPDGCYEDSATVTQIYRNIFPANATGFASGIIGVDQLTPSFTINSYASLLPGQVSASATPVPYNLGFLNNSATGTVSDWFNGGSFIAHPGQAIFLSNFRLIRLVSAGIHVVAAPAATASSGFYIMCPLPRGIGFTNFFPQSSAVPTSTIQSVPGCITTPVNGAKTGVGGIWRPLDSSCYKFTQVDQRAEETGGTNYPTAIADRDLGGWVFCVQGVGAGTSLMVEIVLNYEAIPTLNSMLPGSSAARADPLALSFALNEAEEAPLAKAGANGFDGLSTGEHELAKQASFQPVASHSLVKGTQAALPSVCGMGAVMPVSGPVVYGKQSGILGMLSSVLTGNGNEQPTTLETIMKMLLPMVSKFLPDLLAAL